MVAAGCFRHGSSRQRGLSRRTAPGARRCCRRRRRREGMISTQWSYGVRSSRSPSRASRVPAAGSTSMPTKGSTKANCSLCTVTASVITITFCGAGAVGVRVRASQAGSTSAKCCRNRSAISSDTARLERGPMLSALDQQGVLRARFVGEARRSRACAGRRHGPRRPPRRPGSRSRVPGPGPWPSARTAPAARSGAASSAGPAGSRPGPAIGRSSRARLELDALGAAVELGRVPDAVEVFVDLARLVRRAGVEALKGRDVGERQGQGAARRAHPFAQQEVQRQGAAELVAVDDGRDHHVRARLLGLEAVHEVDAGVALSVGGDVGGGEFDVGRHEVPREGVAIGSPRRRA